MNNENFHPFDKVGIPNVAGVPILTIQGAKPHNIHFQNQAGEQVGLITVENDQLVFTGNADEAARLFFDHALKPMVDAYIEGRLSEGE